MVTPRELVDGPVERCEVFGTTWPPGGVPGPKALGVDPPPPDPLPEDPLPDPPDVPDPDPVPVFGEDFGEDFGVWVVGLFVFPSPCNVLMYVPIVVARLVSPFWVAAFWRVFSFPMA